MVNRQHISGSPARSQSACVVSGMVCPFGSCGRRRWRKEADRIIRLLFRSAPDRTPPLDGGFGRGGGHDVQVAALTQEAEKTLHRPAVASSHDEYQPVFPVDERLRGDGHTVAGGVGGRDLGEQLCTPAGRGGTFSRSMMVVDDKERHRSSVRDLAPNVHGQGVDKSRWTRPSGTGRLPLARAEAVILPRDPSEERSSRASEGPVSGAAGFGGHHRVHVVGGELVHGPRRRTGTRRAAPVGEATLSVRGRPPAVGEHWAKRSRWPSSVTRSARPSRATS